MNSGGDVIFHTRWLFHRTVPFVKNTTTTSNNNDNTKNDGNNDSNNNADNNNVGTNKSRIYRRYSIRYGPGESIIPPG